KCVYLELFCTYVYVNVPEGSVAVQKRKRKDRTSLGDLKENESHTERSSLHGADGINRKQSIVFTKIV
uniref:Uncharacterized protein n=1 Tax=Anopheles minimus TaxID=112268 RepID=A0A182WPS3_9DIPT